MKLSPVALNINSTFPVPKMITHHLVNGINLLIAPEVPAWITVDDSECEVIKRLSRGATLAEAKVCFESWRDADANGKLSALLSRLAVDGFMEEAEVTENLESHTTLQLHVTNACNLRCKHCYVSSGDAFPQEAVLSDWTKVISVARSRYEKVYVSISGGEPLLVPWLPSLLEHIKALGGKTSILSNGMLWTDKRIAQIRPLVDLVNVSLDGASQDIHDSVRGKGSFRQAVRGIRRLGEAGVEVGINVCLMKSNLEDVKHNLHDLVKSFPFEVSVLFGKFVEEGRGITYSSEAPSAAEMAVLLPFLATQFLSSGWSPTSIPKRTNCGFGRSYAIYANGDVSPCLSPRYIVGNILNEDVESIFDRVSTNAAKSNVDRLPLCRTCDLRYICGGKCHLNQLTLQLPIGQNSCSAEYRADYYRKLATRAKTQESVMLPILSKAS